MIALEGIPLAMPQLAAYTAGTPIDLPSLLFTPQTALPADQAPPARTPYMHEAAPGTLYWPQGASRFALGQFLVTDAEVAAIWPSYPTGFDSPVELTFGGDGTGQDAVSFTLYPLPLIPLAVDRSTTLPVANVRALYLLLLVDYRWFFQTQAPDWAIVDGTTTWDALDALLLTFLGAGSTADSVDSAYLMPSSDLAPPTLASEGVIGWCGPLLDLICTASGRRFVANTDGTFSLQSWSSAATANDAALAANADYLRNGGLLAYPPATESTTGQYLVPASITLKFPQRSGVFETAPYSVTTLFASVRAAAGYLAGDQPVSEGDLAVLADLWGDGTNDADLDAYALQWATDWYAWLRGPQVQTYSGAVDYAPNGFVDSLLYCAQPDDVWTRVYRGQTNNRPATRVPGYSGVDPPDPPDDTTLAVVTSVCVGNDSGTASVAEAVQLSSTTWAELTTLELSPTKTTTYTVWGVFDINGSGTADVIFDSEGDDEAIDTYEGRLTVDTVAEDGVATFSPAHPMARATVAQVWQITLEAGTYTLALEGRRASGTGLAYAEATNTTLTVLASPTITVQRQDLIVPGGTVGRTVCEEDPTDCCGGSGSGSGSGSGGSGGGVLTSLCPDYYIPTTLYLVFSNGVGDCSCLDGTVVTMQYVEGTDYWEGTFTACSVTTTLRLTAQPITGWFLINPTGVGCTPVPYVPGAFVCNPLEIEWASLPMYTCCSGSVDATLLEVSP